MSNISLCMFTGRWEKHSCPVITSKTKQRHCHTGWHSDHKRFHCVNDKRYLSCHNLAPIHNVHHYKYKRYSRLELKLVRYHLSQTNKKCLCWKVIRLIASVISNHYTFWVDLRTTRSSMIDRSILKCIYTWYGGDL
jgi:hypothetical protein